MRLFDGVKSVNILSDEGWTYATSDRPDVAKYYKAVGVLYRCVQIRSNAIRRLPWQILQNDKPVWASTERRVPPNFEYAKNIRSLLGLTEAALILSANAFWFKEKNRVKTTKLSWFSPITIAPKWDKQAGLIGYERTVNNIKQPLYAPDEIVYFWYRDPLHETCKDVAPAEAAMAAAGVLYSTKEFVSAFLERGAIKATLLTVEGNPAPQEKLRLKEWWKRFFAGTHNAGSAEVVSAGVKPVIIGEGLQELSNTELTGENREEIATALGVPHSMVFSDAANYATSSQDKLNFYDETVIPECELIQDALNEQLFAQYGYQFEFLPGTLDIYQEDESQRAASWRQYVDGGMKPSVAAEILGIELPQGIEYADLDPEPTPEPSPVIVQPVVQPDTTPVDNQQPINMRATDLDKWKRKALKRLASGQSPLCDFESEHLTDLETAFVRARLAMAKTKDDVTGAFSAQGGGFDQVFFIQSGLAIPKAVLQIDPANDSAEQAARMDMEDKKAKKIAAALAALLALFFSSVDDTVNPNDLITRFRLEFAANQELTDAVTATVQDAADLGVTTATQQFDTVGYGIDRTTADEKTHEWVNGYSVALVAGIVEVTRRRVLQELERWQSNGDNAQALLHNIRPLFGRDRADLIAATEITRAYAEGQRVAYRESGIVTRMEWRTSADERVCPVCAPLDGKRSELDGTFAGGYFPPAHPRCRCWIVPVV